MEFTYKVTLEDLMQFGEHVYRTSSRMRRRKLLWCVLAPVFFAGWALQYHWETREVDWLFLLIASQALLSAFFLPRFFDRSARKEIFRKYVTRPEADDSGTLRLVVADDSLTEIAAARKTKLAWKQIHGVEALPDRIYVYATPLSAIIIPRHGCSGTATYEDLETEILKHVQNREV